MLIYTIFFIIMILYTIYFYLGEKEMCKFECKAYAKINITLDILGKRNDGYHELEMIMQNVSLHDNITAEKTDGEILVSSNSGIIPKGEKNIAYKAAEYMIKKYGIKGGVKIYIEKNIPVGAGLAGGSTDAAAAIKAVKSLYNLKLTEEEMEECASQIGSDVPFCINGKTSLATGRGTELKAISPMPKMYIVLAKPSFGVSTAFVYKNYKAENVEKRPNTKAVIEAIEKGDTKEIAKGLCNVLESVTAKKYDDIEKIKESLKAFGAENAIMSGSGPTVFGIFEDKNTADKAAEKIIEKFKIKEVYSVETI